MDAREFKQRFLPHHQLLYRVAYRLTGNAQDAEDLLQDTYLKLWQKRDVLKDEATNEAYLVTMMKNLYRDQCRLGRIDTSANLSENIEPPDEMTPSRQMEASDELQQMTTLLDGLPERDGTVLKMYLLEERSYKEIEQDTGLTQGYIRIIIMRTKQKLKQQWIKLTKTWTD